MLTMSKTVNNEARFVKDVKIQQTCILCMT